MLGTHHININVPDHLTECILRIEDLSVYDPILPFAAPTLQIQVPGFKECVEFTLITTPQVDQNFIFNLNACHLNLQTENCGLKQYPLPDGIYTIQYSVAPNELIYHKVYHLRVTKIELQLLKEYSKLNIGPCEPGSELDRKMHILDTVKGYIRTAQAFVIHDKNCEKAMEMYGYAKQLLDKMSCKNC